MGAPPETQRRSEDRSSFVAPLSSRALNRVGTPGITVGRQRRIAAITASKSKRGSATSIWPRTMAQIITAVRAKMWKKDRKSVVQGKSVDLGGRRIIKKTTRA